MEIIKRVGDRDTWEAYVEHAYSHMPGPTWYMTLKYQFSPTLEDSEENVRRFIAELNRHGPKDHRNHSRFGYVFCPQCHVNGVIHWHGVIDDEHITPEEAQRVWEEISGGGELWIEPYDPQKYGIWYALRETQFGAIPILSPQKRMDPSSSTWMQSSVSY